ncbi:MAG: DEAD/DEAH box helicase [Steroidobacteraceae bacterium]
MNRKSKLSHLRRPADLTPEAWQRQLRRQFGREQKFKLENLGDQPIFSEFRVGNPNSGGTYRVAIRGMHPGENFCTCPDFATNDLGTCKHIEFVLARLERRPGALRALRRGFRPRYSEIYLRYGGERQVRFRAGSSCPPALARNARTLFSAGTADALPSSKYLELDGFIASARRTGHEVRCYDDVLGFIAQARDAEHRQRTLDAAYPDGPSSPALQKLLNATLYPYQAEGALYAVRAGRCLIADEMGLGKTIQALAAVELMARHFGAERVLVICPTSLKHQWEREIARFSHREPQVVNGGRASRMRCYAERGFCKITNYETLARDFEFIRSWSPDVVIADEAQRIKNWNTVAARALKRIESPYALVLTGTPLENRLEELVSIVQYVDVQRLGPLWRLRHEHQLLDDAGRVVGYKDLDRIGETLRPVMLRRRKADVIAQLPERVAKTIFVEMTRQQLAEHQSNAVCVQQIVQRWRRTGFLSDVDQRRLMAALQNMRMSCNSTYLLDGKTDYGNKCDELTTLLQELLERPAVKVVIFSQWLRTHELIIRRLTPKRWGHVLFHGGVPSARRGALVERFHRDPACRVFLSTDAGGVGLNLQHAASVVINMDLPWNPAVLEQRIGRVHRLGQTKGVQVVNFVAQGAIEEGMLSILAFKKSLFAGVLDGGPSEVFLGGSRLKRFMESVEAVTTVTAAASTTEAPPSATRMPVVPCGLTVTDDPMAVPVRASASSSGEKDDRSRSRDLTAAAAATLENPQPSADSWALLLTTGLKLVESLTAASSGNGNANGAAGDRTTTASPRWIETEAETGRTYLKLPVPDPQVLQTLGDALSQLINSLVK